MTREQESNSGRVCVRLCGINVLMNAYIGDLCTSVKYRTCFPTLHIAVLVLAVTFYIVRISKFWLNLTRKLFTLYELLHARTRGLYSSIAVLSSIGADAMYVEQNRCTIVRPVFHQFKKNISLPCLIPSSFPLIYTSLLFHPFVVKFCLCLVNEAPLRFNRYLLLYSDKNIFIYTAVDG